MLGNYRVAELLIVASRVVLSSTELVSNLDFLCCKIVLGYWVMCELCY
jgi:hypothetical protein